MILTFHGKPASSGQGLCDIDRVKFTDTQKIGKSLYSEIRPITRLYLVIRSA